MWVPIPTAAAQDGDRHYYPIVWVVVDSENENAWTPYTRNTKFHRNDGLEFVPLREVSHSKSALFEEFMRRSYSGILNKCGMWYNES